MKSYTKKDVSYTERPFFVGGKNMPYRPKKPCRHPGCANLTDGRYCEEHISCHPEVTRSATKRGYGSKWRTSSKAYLREHPLCEICKRNGKYVQATVVDHITEVIINCFGIKATGRAFVRAVMIKKRDGLTVNLHTVTEIVPIFICRTNRCVFLFFAV